jgi:hypothetical protein
MADLNELHFCTKYCFKIGKNATETFSLLKVAFGGQTVGTTHVLSAVEGSKTV